MEGEISGLQSTAQNLDAKLKTRRGAVRAAAAAVEEVAGPPHGQEDEGYLPADVGWDHSYAGVKELDKKQSVRACTYVHMYSCQLHQAMLRSSVHDRHGFYAGDFRRCAMIPRCQMQAMYAVHVACRLPRVSTARAGSAPALRMHGAGWIMACVWCAVAAAAAGGTAQCLPGMQAALFGQRQRQRAQR